MIFGLPGAALAIYRQAKPEKKKAVGGLLFSAALTSMLTGITEPLEFSFLFAAPMLFGVHVILAASAYMAAHILGIAVGLTFSGGLLDLFLFGILQGNAKTNWLLILPAGAVYFLLYYGLFSVLIRSFRLKTPGRLDDPSESESTGSSVSDGCSDPVSAAIVQGLGGFQNISDVDCCATRLRITVHDPAKVRRIFSAGRVREASFKAARESRWSTVPRWLSSSPIWRIIWQRPKSLLPEKIFPR